MSSVELSMSRVSIVFLTTEVSAQRGHSTIMSAPILRTITRVVQAPQTRTIVTRTMPRAGGHDDHPHLVFDTAKEPFSKFQAGLIVGGGVSLGIGIVTFAVRHQQYKHGYWKKE